MEMNTDFFKTKCKMLSVRCAAYMKDAYARALHRSRQSTVLSDMRVFLVVMYGRIVLRREYTRYDLIALFIVAVVIGGGIKWAAVQTVTIGFRDYTLASSETPYDLNAVEQQLIDAGGTSLRENAPVRSCAQ